MMRRARGGSIACRRMVGRFAGWCKRLGSASVGLRSRPVGGLGGMIVERAGCSRVTSVTRLPGEHGSALLDVVRSISGVQHHHVCPSTDPHLTIASLDDSNLDEDMLGQPIAEAVAMARPFEVALRGSAMTSPSVDAQAWKLSGARWRLRGMIQESAGTWLSITHRMLGFVNIVRFREPAVGALRSGVQDLAPTDLGRLAVRSVEVLRTGKLLSTGATRVSASGRLS